MCQFVQGSSCNDTIMCYFEVPIDLQFKESLFSVCLREVWQLIVNINSGKE